MLRPSPPTRAHCSAAGPSGGSRSSQALIPERRPRSHMARRHTPAKKSRFASPRAVSAGIIGRIACIGCARHRPFKDKRAAMKYSSALLRVAQFFYGEMTISAFIIHILPLFPSAKGTNVCPRAYFRRKKANRVGLW